MTKPCQAMRSIPSVDTIRRSRVQILPEIVRGGQSQQFGSMLVQEMISFIRLEGSPTRCQVPTGMRFQQRLQQGMCADDAASIIRVDRRVPEIVVKQSNVEKRGESFTAPFACAYLWTDTFRVGGIQIMNQQDPIALHKLQTEDDIPQRRQIRVKWVNKDQIKTLTSSQKIDKNFLARLFFRRVSDWCTIRKSFGAPIDDSRPLGKLLLIDLGECRAGRGGTDFEIARIPESRPEH